MTTWLRRFYANKSPAFCLASLLVLFPLLLVILFLEHPIAALKRMSIMAVYLATLASCLVGGFIALMLVIGWLGILDPPRPEITCIITTHGNTVCGEKTLGY